MAEQPKQAPILTAPEGTYKFTAKNHGDLKAGAWYYGWACQSCKKDFAVFDDQSNGKNPVPIIGEAATAKVTCPLCSVENLQPMEDMKHFKA